MISLSFPSGDSAARKHLSPVASTDVNKSLTASLSVTVIQESCGDLHDATLSLCDCCLEVLLDKNLVHTRFTASQASYQPWQKRSPAKNDCSFAINMCRYKHTNTHTTQLWIIAKGLREATTVILKMDKKFTYKLPLLLLSFQLVNDLHKSLCLLYFALLAELFHLVQRTKSHAKQSVALNQ